MFHFWDYFREPLRMVTFTDLSLCRHNFFFRENGISWCCLRLSDFIYLNVVKFSELILGKIFPFPNFPRAKKSSREICSYFVSFVDISGIRWYELKRSPDILAYNLSVSNDTDIEIFFLSAVKFSVKLLPDLLKNEIPRKYYSRILAKDLLAFFVISYICFPVKS